MPGRQPVITGAGIVCAAGCGREAVWQALVAGRTGLGLLTLFSSPRYAQFPVGEVRTPATPILPGSRSDQLAWVATSEALAQAGFAPHEPGRKTRSSELELEVPKRIRRLDVSAFPEPSRVGISVGATVGGMDGTERVLDLLLRQHRHRFGPLRYHECCHTADALAERLGIHGPCVTFSTACSAGAMAIAAATEMIRNEEADIVLAGGCDTLCRLTLNGFGSLLLLDPAGCRPFDARRTGISLGEGAAFLVIESEASACHRGVPALARLAGWGASCDAHHPTAPHPDGRGAAQAMRHALADAGLEPSMIDFISAHGTATPDNDAMEVKALRQVFGDALPPVSSTKRCFGHTLAASGALKAVVCLQTLEHQLIPPSPGFEIVDPTLNLVPVTHPQPAQVRHVLSSSFGFGGNNVVLIFSHPETPVAAAPNTRPHTHSDRAPAIAPSPRSSRFAIVGAALVSPAGHTLPTIAASLRAGGVIPNRIDLPAPLGPARVAACSCPDFAADATAILDPAKRRRLSRLQQMAVVAAHRALPATASTRDPARIGVAIGTGLGSLTDTAAFVENMILREERSPRPGHFTNSVHNALASQVALELGCTGLNTTPTQRDISFEAALWQASRQIATRAADLFLVGAADELHPYLLATGLRWGWWPPAPDGEPDPANLRPPRDNWNSPGEGAALLALAREDSPAPNLGWISAIRLGRFARTHQGEIDAVTEARWIHQTLERAGEALAGIDLLLVNQPLAAPAATRFPSQLADALSQLANHPILPATYQHGCGRYASASAFGCVVALGLIRGEIQPADCLLDQSNFAVRDQPCGKALLYTWSAAGTKALCCLSRQPD